VSAGRPFPHQFRSAVLRAQLPPTRKLLLLVLLEFADERGGSCFPAMTTIAQLAGINEKTARRELAKPCGFFERTDKAGSGQSWRRYGYQLLIPEGADTMPARWPKEGADTTPAASPERCGHSGKKVRTLKPEGAGTVSDEIGLDIGKSRLEEQKAASRPSSAAVPHGAKTSSRGSTFSEWFAQATESGEAERTGEQLSDYMEKVGIPGDFAVLVFHWAERKFADDPKRQKSWPRALQNYVRQGWHGLWAPSRDGGFYLTTAGVQLQRELATEAGKPYAPTQQHAPSKQLQGLASILGVSAHDLNDSPPPARTQNILEHSSTRKT
jgi:hypothetical protein